MGGQDVPTTTAEARGDADGRAARTDRLSRIVAGVGGAMLVLFGAWAMAAPESFYDALATFEPYNQHFLQDIGAFQIGLGAVLLVALTGRDGLTVALLGVGAGLLAHTVSHLLGTDLGGNPATDIPFFAILTGITLYVGWLRWRDG